MKNSWITNHLRVFVDLASRTILATRPGRYIHQLVTKNKSILYFLTKCQASQNLKKFPSLPTFKLSPLKFLKLNPREESLKMLFRLRFARKTLLTLRVKHRIALFIRCSIQRSPSSSHVSCFTKPVCGCVGHILLLYQQQRLLLDCLTYIRNYFCGFQGVSITIMANVP